MIFQIIDDKKECFKLFVENKFNNNVDYNLLTQSWSYSPYFKNKNINYANIFCEGKSLEEICPDDLKLEFKSILDKFKSYKKSFIQSKISLDDNCLYDLIPEKDQIKFCLFKNKVSKYVFEKFEKPKEYNFLLKFNELLIDIQNKNLNIDEENLKKSILTNQDLISYKRLLNVNKNISYNLFGSITGRLSTNKNSFPIQNFPKSLRHLIKPHNKWFVAFDMNAAELRTSLGLLNKNEFNGDLYETLNEEIYNNSLTRKQVKEATTAWLYNSANTLAVKHSEKLNNFFEKEKLLNYYWDGNYVNTIFSRKIESDKFHAIPYLNQSTFIDLFHRQTLKINNYLDDKKSFISFLLHDELVVDLSEDETEHLIEMVKILKDTQLGKFSINIKVGKDYGNMKKINLKV